MSQRDPEAPSEVLPMRETFMLERLGRQACGVTLAAVALFGVDAAVHAQGKVDLALELVTFGLDNPVFVIGLPDDSSTLLVVEQGGRILVIQDDKIRNKPFLDIRSRVGAGGERGLLSVVPAPGWPADPFMFVNYTNKAGDTVIERYKATKSRKKLRRGSAREVITIPQPFSNHNGGQLAFGPDGMLYIGMGDGGSGGDPLNNAQDLTSLHGKMLRVDVSELPFAVPTDNPTLPGVGMTSIWSLGLRNPWRFSFDRQTGDMYIADVGQNAVEEINFERAGKAGGVNYGWKIREGSQTFSGSTAPATQPLVDPIHEYSHAEGQSVTGGYVYRGAAIPEIDGYYFYADFVTQRIWSFTVRKGKARRHMEWTDMLRSVGDETIAVSSFGEDANGELYICSFFEGAIYRIVRAEGT